MARPSLYTPELFESILDKLSGGTPLAEICRADGMPVPRTIRNWMRDNEEMTLAYHEARDDGFDAIAAEILRIADTPLPGMAEVWEWVVVDADGTNPQVKPAREWRMVKREVADMLGHRKLQIETRLKLLAKWDPKRYGDRLDLNHSGQLTLEQLVSQAVAKPASSSSNDADSSEAAAA